MKKNIFFILFVVICQFSIIAANNKFIKIPKVNAIIGNDKFKAFRQSFTGVAGETEEEGLKYFRKEHTVVLDAYFIKKHLITNGEFLEFLNKSKYKTSYEIANGENYRQFLKNKDYPVKRITFFDAVAYCQWKSDVTGKNYRLPTSAEWEYAALANTKRIFPWGDQSKILPSTKTDSVVGRDNFSVYEIKEDISPLGMANLMGGVEYTLDCLDESFYEKSPSENPICLIPVQGTCTMRGIFDYNKLENDIYGLYDLIGNGIDDFNGYPYFRIVEAKETIFNKNTTDEAIYNPLIGKAKKVRLYNHPSVSDDFSEYDIISDVYILFENPDKTFYRCFVQVSEISLLGKLRRTWKTGWIESSNVSITSKKWYEN
ncbi:MAG: formylglycine-generating enzyme family protein [Treponema sp.]